MKDHCERIVSFLPLSHVAANITDVFVLMTCAGTVYFADRDALKGTLTATLRDAQPTLFLAVPRVWEKIYEKMMEVGRANKGLKKQGRFSRGGSRGRKFIRLRRVLVQAVVCTCVSVKRLFQEL